MGSLGQREDKMRLSRTGVIISVLAGVLPLPSPQADENTKLLLPGTDLVSAGAGFAAGVVATSIFSGALNNNNNNNNNGGCCCGRRKRQAAGAERFFLGGGGGCWCGGKRRRRQSEQKKFFGLGGGGGSQCGPCAGCGGSGNQRCDCSSLTFYSQGQGQGNCQSRDESGRRWCYTTGWLNNCGDLVSSHRYPNNPWSYNACGYNG